MFRLSSVTLARPLFSTSVVKYNPKNSQMKLIDEFPQFGLYIIAEF